jgi:hypothetical protein
MLTPDMSLANSAPAVGFIHLRLANADIYFVANTANQPVHTEVSFRAGHKSAESLDADTGKAQAVRMNDGKLELSLAPYESRIFLLHDGPSAAGATGSDAGDARVVADLSTGWRVRFDVSGVEHNMNELISWTEFPETRWYSGTATYTRMFDLPCGPPAHARLLLSFGIGKPIPEPASNPGHPGMEAFFDPPIREVAVIWINGKRAGSLWHPPYELDITSLLKAGSNELKVQVANTAINRLAGESQPDYRLLWARYGRRFVPQDMDNLRPLPSGLLGRIEVIQKNVP